MRWFTLVIFSFAFHSLGMSQTTDPNILPDLDDYTILRSMVSKTFDAREDNISYEYKLHKKEVGLIKYFIDGNSFEAKSNLDIYNRILYADFDRDGLILPHEIDSRRIDSLYLYNSNNKSPSVKYFYNTKADEFAEVIQEGKYTIAEAYVFKLQKRNVNPVLDAGSFEDKIILKKVSYLIDTGHWYKIPKNKNEYLKFIHSHFRRKLPKSRLKGYSTIEYTLKLNQK